MSTTVRLHSERAEALFRQMGGNAAVAASRAINKSIRSGRTVVASLTAKDTGLKVSTVRDALFTREAMPDRLVARVSASPKRLPLIEFRARGPYPSRGRGSVTALTAAGRRRTYAHAFIAVMPSGHKGVFRRSKTRRMRRNARRQAIFELRGPSIAHVALKHAAAGEARAQLQLAKNMAAELRFAVSANR